MENENEVVTAQSIEMQHPDYQKEIVDADA